MQPPPRARPLAEAPVDALLARADELAKRWAIALILARPLQRIGEVPLEDLAREAPALCAQALRALESDAELEQMAGGAAGGRDDSPPARRIWALAGARDGGEAVEAVEALRGVLWEALLEELRAQPSATVPPISDRSLARQVADLADRLAHVCATALAATLARHTTVTVHHPEVVRADREEVVYDSDRSPLGRRAAVLVDEREDVRAPAGAAGRRARARSREDWVPEGRIRHGGTVPRSGPRSAGDRVPPFSPRNAPRTSEAQRSQARPLPWDTPLRAERAGEPAPGEADPETTAEGGGPVMRVTRRPTAPVDGSS